ncbi:MAG: hypothetical protein ACUVTP_01790 [Candidatus Fervidibacter sp.]
MVVDVRSVTDFNGIRAKALDIREHYTFEWHLWTLTMQEIWSVMNQW